jgi:type IV secretion system protein VirD4
MRDLLDPRQSSQQVCQAIWAKKRHRKAPLVRLNNAVHTAVFSPSGGGKGVSFVVPFLQTCPDSCVVIDFKGENAALTAAHRERFFKQRSVQLDPYHVVTETPDMFNPLDFIDRDDPHALDHCNDLAKALVVREGTEPDPHWNDSAESWIAAVIATVVYYGERGETRSLQTVREILTDPEKLEMAVQAMCESDCWGGMLKRRGGQLLHFIDKEKSSTLTTVSRHLSFLDTPAVAACTRSSSFDPAELRSSGMTVYLILPPEHMRAQSALLRVWIGSLMRASIQGGIQEYQKNHFILDEAASLGHLEIIDDAVDKFRGFGIRLQFYFQSAAQLKKCFPHGQDSTLLSNTSQIYFGTNTVAEAEQISSRLGESTVVVESGGQSSGRTQQATYDSASPNSSSGKSSTDSSNWSLQARKLLKPEEVIQLPQRTAITFVPGVPPILTTMIRYYEEKSLGTEPGCLQRFATAVMTLVAAVCSCVAMLATVTALTGWLLTDGAGSLTRMLFE